MGNQQNTFDSSGKAYPVMALKPINLSQANLVTSVPQVCKVRRSAEPPLFAGFVVSQSRQKKYTGMLHSPHTITHQLFVARYAQATSINSEICWIVLLCADQNEC